MSIAERWGRFIAGSESANASAREQRRGFSVMFYCGKNGSGKSLAAVYDTMPDLDNRVPVLSTVRLLDYRDPRPCGDLLCPCDKTNANRHGHAHPAWIPWTTWGQMLRLREGVALADEITGVASSTDSASLPAQAADELHRLRARDVTLRITGLSFIRADKKVREAVTGVTRCSSSYPVPAFHEDGRPRMWRPRRLADWQTYDAESLPIDDISETAWEKADHKVGSRLWVPDTLAVQAYDTYATVLRVGQVDSAGRCVDCGGRRTVPECDCEDYVARKTRSRGTARKARSAEDGDAAPGLAPEVSSLPLAGMGEVEADTPGDRALVERDQQPALV